MKVKELVSVIFDKVIIYIEEDRDYKDIYKGNADNIPSDILTMDVKIVGAKRKGIIDIQVL